MLVMNCFMCKAVNAQKTGENKLAVVELTKLAGEPLDIFVNSKLVARGEAVVVNEKFGVRLVDIVSPNERVEKIL